MLATSPPPNTLPNTIVPEGVPSMLTDVVLSTAAIYGKSTSGVPSPLVSTDSTPAPPPYTLLSTTPPVMLTVVVPVTCP